MSRQGVERAQAEHAAETPWQPAFIRYEQSHWLTRHVGGTLYTENSWGTPIYCRLLQVTLQVEFPFTNSSLSYAQFNPGH